MGSAGDNSVDVLSGVAQSDLLLLETGLGEEVIGLGHAGPAVLMGVVEVGELAEELAEELGRAVEIELGEFVELGSVMELGSVIDLDQLWRRENRMGEFELVGLKLAEPSLAEVKTSLVSVADVNSNGLDFAGLQVADVKIARHRSLEKGGHDDPSLAALRYS